MIGDTSLRIVVCPDLRGSVARRYHCLAFVGNVVQVFLMFFVINERTQAGKCAFLVFRLVARLRTFDQDLFAHAGVRVLPDVSQTYARFDLVHILAAGTSRTESIPLNFTFINFNIKLVCFGEHSHGSC